MSDKKKTTMLDLVGSPSFNYTAAADALNTADAIRVTKKTKKDVVDLDRREKIHRALQRFGLSTAGASIASPVTAPVTEIAGGVSDFIDGTLYLLEKKYGDAALSYASILPVMGGLVASRRGFQELKDSGKEYYTFYRSVGDDVPEELFTSKALKGAENRSGGFIRKGEDVHVGPINEGGFMGVPETRESFMEVFGLRDAKIVGDDFFYPKVFDAGGQRIESYPMGLAHLWTSNTFESATDFARRNPNSDKTATVLRFDIPVDELKNAAKPTMMGPNIISNDLFLKKRFGIGTGISGSTDGIMGVRGAYDPPHGPSYTIFQEGIPSRYFTGAIKGTPEDLLKQGKTFTQDAYNKF